MTSSSFCTGEDFTISYLFQCIKIKNMNKKLAVALDIGGTKIEGMLIDSDFKIMKKEMMYFSKKIRMLI